MSWARLASFCQLGFISDPSFKVPQSLKVITFVKMERIRRKTKTKFQVSERSGYIISDSSLNKHLVRYKRISQKLSEELRSQTIHYCTINVKCKAHTHSVRLLLKLISSFQKNSRKLLDELSTQL